MTTITYITSEELWQEMEDGLAEYRMTVEEFRVEGEADTLTDGYLRDLWLEYKPLLFDDEPDDGSRSDSHSLDVERDRGPGRAGRTRPRAIGRDRHTRPREIPVRYITREELWQEMVDGLAEYRMTVEEFRAEGEADTLTDGHLRDLWLMYRPLLFDDEPDDGSRSDSHSLDVERDPGSGRSGRTRSGTSVRDGHRRSEMTTVQYVTHDELMDELKGFLEEYRMTVEEFRAEGEADTLTDGYLRNLWLKYRPLIFDE